ncbi:hypothetical protein BH09ACT8_BH09ACT8_11260 [soil metagenome]
MRAEEGDESVADYAKEAKQAEKKIDDAIDDDVQEKAKKSSD